MGELERFRQEEENQRKNAQLKREQRDREKLAE